VVGKEAEGELRRFFVDVPHLVLAQANVGIRWCGACSASAATLLAMTGALRGCYHSHVLRAPCICSSPSFHHFIQ
jgi:hypothetical protein